MRLRPPIKLTLCRCSFDPLEISSSQQFTDQNQLLFCSACGLAHRMLIHVHVPSRPREDDDGGGGTSNEEKTWIFCAHRPPPAHRPPSLLPEAANVLDLRARGILDALE